MAKKKQDNKEATLFIASGNKLKEGDLILYTTNYTVDKTSVKEVVVEKDKQKKVTATYAILANQVKVHLDISKDGLIRRINPNDERCTIKVWSEATEIEYNYRLAKISLKNNCNNIVKSIDEFPRETIIKLDSKIKHLLERYG